ncbi:Type 3 restriction-modification enzyme helicase subunit [Desulfurella amilsii]|uniref:Type 3 restriction-modification enzyme helicase subunit n=1 Tax=Desulfurella amilsii TaxID=1562698 RepID=A0A1X4XVT7_9BACT|nr:DEAD/DEAH box helicase family protein [Desulfurella amilsii]OSS41652.1 Type 3 restriction-modification enzyme helicase subunit [Desulfurella amilsii]
MKPTELLLPEQRFPSKAYLVNELRKAIFSWREQGYPNTTPTTRRLLQFWFSEDHIVNNELFELWFCQREGIETLIYVYEAMKKRNFIDMARDFGAGPIQGYDPSYDQYPFYAFKMATGSGKTFVMALSIIWQYFNYKKENKEDYTSKFLLIAGEKNVIYDRLTRDFKDGKIFRNLPLIPPEWQEEFDLKVILKEDLIHVILEEVLFLTNIQQLEQRRSKKKEVEEYVDNVMELPEVYNVSDIYQENRIKEVLTSCPNIMILKDEAHHIYSFEKAWKKILLGLNKNLVSGYGKGINMELDFSATPKTETGALFPWIIVDFSLKEAIEMNIVKFPLKGMVKNAKEIASTKAVERYRAWIDAGIRRWREYKKALKPLSKKPVLFFQCPENKEADEIFEYINSTVPDLKNKVLRIHTDSTGEVNKADLPMAREFAKNIDDPDPEKNPYEAIVSTLMLNEGWDVRNVNVIVGLRSYTSKRRVLSEQVIGRGLRKMFPEEDANVDKSINVLEVIGPPGLIDILEELENQEGIKFVEFDTDKSLNLTTIFLDENKLDKDIEIPILSPRILIREFYLDEIEINNLPSLKIPLENKIIEMEYVAIDMLKGMEVIKRKWELPVPKDSKSVIAYYTDQILKQLKIGGAFARFYPMVKRYVVEKLFTQEVDLEDPRVLYKLSSPEVQEQLINLFVNAFRDMTFIERKPEKRNTIKLSDTIPFVWSKLVYPANRCIFNYVPCDNNFEVDFAKFLDKAEDVKAFSKIVVKMGFFVEYRDSNGNLRLYYPDFVVSTDKDEHIIIETKGREDVDVEHKDKRIKLWCEDATNLMKSKWSFIRVDQADFEKYRFKNIKELVSAQRR